MNQWTEPVEFKGHPGFYLVPGNDRVAISKDGVCISRDRGSVLTPVVPNHGYPTVRNARDNVSKAFTIHRLLGLTFIPVPQHIRHIPRKKLHVNHIDGIKINFKLENLEWTTAKENVNHGFRNGLSNSTRAVLARHVMSGEVQKFVSVAECARAFEIHEAKLYKHLISPAFGKISCDWHVFKFDDESPWPELAEEDRVESKWQFAGIVTGKKIGEDVVYVFNNMRDAAFHTGINHSTLINHRCTKGQDVPLYGWVFQKHDNAIGVDTSGLTTGTNYKGRKRK